MNIFKRVYHAFFKRWGNLKTKQQIWDEEFKCGKWDYLEIYKNDIIYGYIKKYSSGGSILDLGCGSGNTCKDLDSGEYTLYTGVDISDVAIKKARSNCESIKQKHRENEFIISDVIKYEPAQRYDVILFRESLYYLPYHKIIIVLNRYSRYLTPKGVFIVRICERKRYKKIILRIRKDYTVIEEYHSTQDTASVIVFN